MSLKLSVFRFLSAVVVFCLAGRLCAQVTEIDTSEYLPLFYSGSLEYNLTVAASLGYSTEIERLVREGAEVDVENSAGRHSVVFCDY